MADTTATVSADGIYIGGGFVGSYDALPLTLVPNADGKDVWVGIASLAASGGHFTILNGICSDWSCKEDLIGQSCSDPNANDDRTNLLGGFTQDTTIVLEYGSCTRPVSSTDISEVVNDVLIYPNPTVNIINIKTPINMNSLVVYNMIGNLVMTRNVNSNSHTFDVTSLRNGVYFISLNFNDGSVLNSRFIKK